MNPTERDDAYDAFISYRRSDGAIIAGWLRNKLQGYKLPTALSAGRDKLRIYLDTAFERANEDFWANNIEPALRKSRYLIVIATPDTLRKRFDGQQNWVEREIEFFRKLPQGRNIFVIRAKGKFDDELPGQLSQHFPRISMVDMTGFIPLVDPLYTRAPIREHILTILGTLHNIDGSQMPQLRMEDSRRARTAVIRLTVTTVTLFAIISSLAIVAWVQRARLQRELTLSHVQRLVDLSRAAVTPKHDFDERAALYARQAYLLNHTIDGSLEGETYEAMRSLLYDRFFVRQLPSEGQLMIQNLAMSPNGMWAAVYDNDDSNQPPYHDPYPERVVGWNLAAPLAAVQNIDPDVRPFLNTSLVVGNNGIAALAASPPCEIHVFDLKEGKALSPIVTGDGDCGAFTVSPSGNEIAVSTAKGIRRIPLDPKSSEPPRLFSSDRIAQFSYFPDSSRLVGVSDRTIIIWPLNGASSPVTFTRSPSPAVLAIANDPWSPRWLQISPLEDRIAFSTPGHFAGKERNLTVLTDLREKHPEPFADVDSFHGFDRRGRMLLEHYGDDHLWVEGDVDESRLGLTLPIETIRRDLGPSLDVEWSVSGLGVMKNFFSVNLVRLPERIPSGRMPTWPHVLLSQVGDKAVVWSLESDMMRWDPLQPENKPRVIKSGLGKLCAPAQNGIWALSQSSHAVRLDDNGNEQENVDLSQFGVNYCEATDAPDTFVFSSSSKIRVLEIVGGHAVVSPVPLTCGTVVVSTNGKRMACDSMASNQPGTFMWTAGSKGSARQITSDRLERIVLSADGKWLAGARGRTIEVFQLDRANSPPITLRGHTQEPAGMAFNSDNTLLASGSFDGTIRIWPLTDSSRQGWVLHVGQTAFGMKFLEPKKLFYSADYVYVLDLDPAHLADDICKIVSRNLTEEEWKTALPNLTREATCPGLPLQ